VGITSHANASAQPNSLGEKMMLGGLPTSQHRNLDGLQRCGADLARAIERCPPPYHGQPDQLGVVRRERPRVRAVDDRAVEVRPIMASIMPKGP